jgi:hypothetical protein
MSTETTELVFYRAVRTYRNARTIGASLISGAIAGFYGSFVIRDQLAHKPASTPATLLTLFFGFLFFFGMRKIVLGVREPVELSADGVRARGKSWSWDSIVRIGKMRVSFSDLVHIKVEVRPPGGGPRTLCLLRADQPLTPAEYSEIAARVKKFALAKYPRVAVDV